MKCGDRTVLPTHRRKLRSREESGRGLTRSESGAALTWKVIALEPSSGRTSCKGETEGRGDASFIHPWGWEVPLEEGSCGRAWEKASEGSWRSLLF